MTKSYQDGKRLWTVVAYQQQLGEKPKQVELTVEGGCAYMARENALDEPGVGMILSVYPA